MKILFVDFDTNGHHGIYLKTLLGLASADSILVLPQKVEGYIENQYCIKNLGRNMNYNQYRKVLHEILKALVNKTELNFTSSDANGIVTVIKDFSNDTNVFVCHLAGHQHRDASAKTDGVLSVIHTSDCYSGYRPQGYYPNRTPGTITEHAISIFCIDFGVRKVKMIRIGAGNNNEWDY